MAKAFKGYIGGWQQGQVIPIWIPETTGTIPYHQGGTTINDLTQNYPYIFDHTYTMFCKDNTGSQQAESIGFTNVINGASSASGIYIYIAPRKWLYCSGNNNCRLWDDGTLIGTCATGGGSGQDNLTPLPSLMDGQIPYTVDPTSDTTFQISNPATRTPIALADYQAFWADATPIGKDPFADAGTSTQEGGTGTFSDTSDDIDFPNLPTLSAADTGFITLFNPTAAQLKSLANYMWSNPLFDLDAWKKIFADPMDAILGLSIVPVAVPSGGSSALTVGNISTGISLPLASTQYVIVDCGSLNVEEFWGAYLDYSPYTKCEIYLPYCGIHPINTDDIMGKSIHIKYHVDILSGACCAYIKCGSSVLYSFIGQCSSSIPITGDNWTNVINGVLSAAVSVGSMVATGGATAPAAVPGLVNTVTNDLKPEIEKSGALGGTGGMLGIQKPYMILTRPRQALPERQNEFMGYPSFITTQIGNLTGYTECEIVHLDGIVAGDTGSQITATEAEITEIENILKGGFIA